MAQSATRTNEMRAISYESTENARAPDRWAMAAMERNGVCHNERRSGARFLSPHQWHYTRKCAKRAYGHVEGDGHTRAARCLADYTVRLLGDPFRWGSRRWASYRRWWLDREEDIAR